MVVRKILLYPNRKQKQLLKQWCGTYRWIYNSCVRLWESHHLDLNQSRVGLRSDIRKAVIDKEALRYLPWALKVPYDVRDGAVREFMQNLTTELGKCKNAREQGREHHFRLSYKSRFDSSMFVQVLKRNWSKGRWFPTCLGPKPLRGAEPLPLKLEQDCKLVKTRFNRFYLCIVTKRSAPVPPPAAYKGSCIALDPGIRTFLTGYDPSGRVIEIGANDSDGLFRMCKKVDLIMSKVHKAANHKQRYQRSKAAARAREAIKNRVTDLHRKTAKYLCETFETIFLPLFQSSSMVRRSTRKIRSRTARMMMTFSHYTFRQHLIHKAKDYQGVHVVLVDEAYTSKTCGACGCLHNKLGGSKLFRCPECSLEMDRDVNGARNIYIRSVEALGGCVSIS